MQDTSACENLIKEISTSISCNTSIQNQLRANLYEKAYDVKDVSIKANQAEILCWSNFIIAFDKSINKIVTRDRPMIIPRNRWFDEDMFFNEMNPTKVNTVTSNDDMYFDEMNK
ncbi:10046_t:CDS:2, partial [Funneliformis geosporum]